MSKRNIKKFPELFDVTLDDAVRDLQKAINYGDYLAEQKMLSGGDSHDYKSEYRRQRRAALSNKEVCNAKDAKARAEQADEFAKTSLEDFEKSEIELTYLGDLFKNNHDRIEALRTIISSKKQTLETYRQNAVN